MPGEESQTATGSSDEKGNNIWSLLPSFDPTTDDAREYRDKVIFLHSICPARDRSMLAPRLAMLCKGTAWSQVKALDATKLMDAESGVKVLLQALATWDESAELQTYEKFEKAIYKTQQKNDESTMSFVNRLTVAFHELGDQTTIKELRAFILLRQSGLSSEDKRKVITMTGGDMEAKKIEQAMRTLSTRILASGTEMRKKVYPANYVEEDFDEANLVDDGIDEEALLEQWAEQGDEDALFVTEYEEQVLDLVQELPEMANCFSAYAAARNRLKERVQNRGFWPNRSAKGGRGKGQNGGKSRGRGTSARRSLSDRIANSNCRICGRKGHWRLECPMRSTSSTTSASNAGEVSNFAASLDRVPEDPLNEPMIMDAHTALEDELPKHTIGVEEFFQNLSLASSSHESSAVDKSVNNQKDKKRSSPVPSLIKVQSSITNMEQHEELVVLNPAVMLAAADIASNRLLQLCRKWGKLRDATECWDRALIAERAEVAILDTGASRTVVGKENFKRFTAQLPEWIRRKIRMSASSVVFRFGNNATQPSIQTAHVPFGQKQWFPVEIVAGQTPFLLSNAFLRQLQCKLDFKDGTLWIPKWQKKIPLTVGNRGLYLVDIPKLLDLSSEVATIAVETNTEPTDMNASLSSSSPFELPQPSSSPSPLSSAHHGPQATLRAGAERPRGRRPQSRDSREAGGKADRSENPGRVERLHIGDRQASRQAVWRCSRTRSRIRSLFGQSGRDRSVPSQLPELCGGSQQCKDAGQDADLPFTRTRIHENTNAGSSQENGAARHAQESLRSGSGPEGSDDSRVNEPVIVRSPSASEANNGGEAQSLLGPGGLRRDPRDPDEGGCGSRVHQATGDADGRAPARLGPSSTVPRELREAVTESKVPETKLDPDQTAFLLQSLEALHAECVQDVHELGRRHVSLPSVSTPKINGQSCLEVNTGRVGLLKPIITAHGGQCRQVELTARDLRQFSKSSGIWKTLKEWQPTHVWVNFRDVGMRSDVRILGLELCSELYFEQVERGGHFHLFSEGIFEDVDSECAAEMLAGTLLTDFNLSKFPKAPRFRGNCFLNQRAMIRTTSVELHEALDHRYLQRQPQIPSDPQVDRRHCRYREGLAKNVVRYILKKSPEKPLIREELCAHIDDKREASETLTQQALKRRRRYTHKQSPRQESYGKSEATWQGVLRKLNTRVPRVGNHVIAPEDELIESIQQLVPNLKVHHAEACKGVNRLRIPVGSYNPREVTHRYTVVMNRHNGEIEADDNVEHWAVLPKYKQVRAGKPARIALTMFGVPPEQVPVNPETSPVGDTSSRTRSAVSMTPVDPEPTESKIAWGPPPIANHGPAFLKLSPEERGDLRQLHHNLGHPDPQKMMRYLRHGGADKGVQQAALEYQCDACTESRKGFTAARPSAIHENLAFNTKVGMDLVTWRNAKGHDFHFVHFLDESTLFHLGSECRGGASEVMEHFETVWANWAGYPQEVYVDPGGEFVSDAFAVRMQETGVHVKMSASDSHWQLGRTEIHGSTVKGMLSKMDLEKAIDSSLDFQAALRQVFHAKNTLCRADGYTPQQSVLGISPRLPGSLLSDSNAAPHALADSATTEGERFLERLRLRESARRAFHYVDNSSSFRRALLRRTRPLRQDWEKGDLVLYWKRRGGNLRREHGRWHGPAENLAIEKQKVVWLSHAGRLIRASPEQLRAASLREWARLPKDSLGHPLEQGRDLKEKLKQAPSFLDLEDEGTPTDEDMLAPLEERSEGGSLPEPEPDSEEATVESTRPNILSVPPDFPLPDLTPQQLENQAASQNIPVPDDSMSDLEFGDTETQGSEETSDVMFGVVDQCWEIDVTPPETWQLPQTVDEDMIFLASESRKKRVEVRLRDLTVSDQKRFAAAKHKEVNAWLSHGTVRRIVKGKIPPKNIMRRRWIYTWKTAEANDPANPDGRKAKARLVILGFEDPDIDWVPNDAPTLTKDGRQLLIQKIASNRWQLCSFDISTAFLHGKGDGRLLGIQAPGEIREALGMGPQDDCELKGGAYGRIDAPYLWYQELRKALLDLNFQQCPLDPCLFSLSSRDTTGQSRSHGVIGIHVDDGICGGDSVFHAALEKLRQRFSFGSFEKGSFVFTGIRLHQWDDMSIEMDQTDYIESIDAINVPRDRWKHPDAPVTEAERRLLRQLIGSLQHAAVHTRADVCAKVGELQSAVNQAKVFHLLEANRVLQEAKQHHVSIMVVPIAESELTFCAFSDASFASNTKNHAHQGTVIFSTSASILENNTAVVCPMAWASKKISRVVRSTLGAEAIALSNTVDRLSWIRILWAWLKNDQVAWHRPEEALQSEPTAAAVTDCKSVYDIISRTAPPQCEEHRTTIECLLIRQRMQDNCRLRWVASQAMLADCLTKSMDASRLRECLRTGRYSLFDEDRVLKQRADKRQQLRWVKGEPEEVVPEERGEACLHSSHEK